MQKNIRNMRKKKTKLFSNLKQVSLSEYAQIKQLFSEIFIFILATTMTLS